MPRTIRKQISLFLPLPEWKAMRAEAARQQIPITELCRRWMHPEMERLRQSIAEAGPQHAGRNPVNRSPGP